MASTVRNALQAVRSLDVFTRKKQERKVSRLLICGPRDVTELLYQTYVSKSEQKLTIETLNVNRLRGIGAGWSRLQVSLNDAFLLAFYLDDEDCFQAISAFRELIISVKGEEVPLLVVGYNRATSAPRIMGPETADCLMTIEWGVGYTEASVGHPGSLDQVFEELFKIIIAKQTRHNQVLRTSTT